MNGIGSNHSNYTQVSQGASTTGNQNLSIRLAFDVVKAENDAWILSEFAIATGEYRHRVCLNTEALYEEIVKWAQRAIEQHRIASSNGLALGADYLNAARDVLR